MPAVVLSLAFYAAYDPVTPGALSASRRHRACCATTLGFDGVAITDDLGAGAVRSGYLGPQGGGRRRSPPAPTCVRIDAPEDQAGVREAIVAAVGDGTLPLERLAAGRRAGAGAEARARADRRL